MGCEEKIITGITRQELKKVKETMTSPEFISPFMTTYCDIANDLGISQHEIRGMHLQCTIHQTSTLKSTINKILDLWYADKGSKATIATITAVLRNNSAGTCADAIEK